MVAKAVSAINKAYDFLDKQENNSYYYHFEYGLINEDGKPFAATNHACHAEMSSLKGKPAAVWSKYPKPGYGHNVDEAAVLAFNDWLVHRSPWNKAVMPDMNTKFVIKKGVVCPVNIPANYLVNFLIATRIACEHPKHVIWWNKLVNAGVNEDMAFVFGCLLAHASINAVNISISKTFGFSHHPFELFTKERVSNFINHKIANPSKNYEDNKDYRPCTAVWGNKTGYCYSQFLMETYPDKGAVKSVRTFLVGVNYDGEMVSHTFAEWAEIANIEHKRITHDVKQAVEEQEPAAVKPRRHRKKAA